MDDDDLDEKIRREMERRFREFAQRVAAAPHPAPEMTLPRIGSGRPRMRPGERIQRRLADREERDADKAAYHSGLHDLAMSRPGMEPRGPRQGRRRKPPRKRPRWDDRSSDPHLWSPCALKTEVLCEMYGAAEPPEPPTDDEPADAWPELDAEPPEPGEPLTAAISRLRASGDPRLLALAGALEQHGRDAAAVSEALGCSPRHARRLLAEHAPAPRAQEIH